MPDTPLKALPLQKARLSVVMPAFNEGPTIEQIVRKVLVVPHVCELIIVDDCSTDDTGDVARKLAADFPAIRYFRHEINQGKTAALRTGFAATTGDIVVVQDADLEYDPSEIPELIAPIIEEKADVVFGSRFMVRRAARVLYFSHYLANRFLTFFSNVFTNVNMSDIETCYKAFRGDLIRSMRITSSGFGFEVEVTAKMAKRRCRIYEVPISYYGRTYEEGKKIGIPDGIAAFWYVLRYNLFSARSSAFREEASGSGTIEGSDLGGQIGAVSRQHLR
ncbi:MAG: glycosyltransferase family 2 protein [Acidobacteria bacterium]|nr:glycosyltransferase family 2 protein [Acidobacteriota bacterium]